MNRGISDAGLSYAAAPHVHGRGVGGARLAMTSGRSRKKVMPRKPSASHSCARAGARREQSAACGKLPPDCYMPFELIFSAAAQAGGVCKPAQNGAAQ